MIRWILVAVLGAATPSLSSVLADDAPWNFNSVEVPSLAPRVQSLSAALLGGLVDAYRSNGANVSVARCIFDVSCSHFAERAFSRYGLVVGGVLFVDRYFYRENQAARALYPLVGEPDGTYRLDDGPFVP